MRSVTDDSRHAMYAAISAALPAGDVAAAARRQRGLLEEARGVFTDRLARASDDYEATNALRLVYQAIDGLDPQSRDGVIPFATPRRWSPEWRIERRRAGRARHDGAKGATTPAAAVTVKPPEHGMRSPARRRVHAPVSIDGLSLDRAADDGWPPDHSQHPQHRAGPRAATAVDRR
ncbi:MAG TPA: hypothetical protein VFC33_19285 [Acidimicrobiia bacterium]|nr:hypothetical protein [Acidimicrobiia bacterium]